MKRRGAVLLFAVVAAVGLCMGPAGAAGHRHHGDVLVVDDDHDPASCHGRHADFDSIQAAINHPDTGAGDTILVCPGKYKETVKVTKAQLTIKGAKAGHDATRRGRQRESVVTHLDPEGTVQLLADDIRWDGFTIQGVFRQKNGPGMYTSPDASGYDIRDTIFENNGIGLYLGSSGDQTTIVCRNRFIANNEFEGTGGANGIYSDKGARDVLIVSNRFERHNGAGILFADSNTGIRQQNIRVGWNKSIDDKTFAAFFATSQLRLHRNLVRARVNDRKFPARVSAIFIGARNDDVIVHRNRVQSASGNGIDVSSTGQFDPASPTNVALLKNWVEHAQRLGISVSAPGQRHYEVRGNRAFNNTRVGLHLGPATDHVFLIGNKALDNGRLDCQDESTGDGTARTANTWQKNLGNRARPRGICSPPTGTEPHHGGGHHHRHQHHHDPCRCTFPRRF
jgi:Right handed beta helix region